MWIRCWIPFGFDPPVFVLLLAVLVSAVLSWAIWPMVVFHTPQSMSSGRPADLIVVLDGGSSRLEQAERFRQQVLQEHLRPGRSLEPAHLLIRCPRASSPPQPMPELLRGYDTVTQITALANWLQHRQAPAPQRIWISRIALAGRGIQIQPDPPPTPSPSEHRKLLRDALRLTLWRFTGSTGAWLVPQIVARKRAGCGV